MDIRCPQCGEPWDMDTLREEAEESERSYGEVRSDFMLNGCKALGSR